MSKPIDTELQARILRCIPDAGSGETVGPYEVMQRLGLPHSPNAAAVYFKRLLARGLVMRLRLVAYQLAGKAVTT